MDFYARFADLNRCVAVPSIITGWIMNSNVRTCHQELIQDTYYYALRPVLMQPYNVTTRHWEQHMRIIIKTYV